MKSVDTIAIVDDDEIYKFTTIKIIQVKQLADKILSFSDGKEAFTYLKQNATDTSLIPNIILLDLNMPVMDGWEFLEHYNEIRSSLDKKINVYILTSSIDSGDLDKFKLCENVAGYIVKPIQTDKLISVIESY